MYAVYVALHINDPDALLTDESVTEAIGAAADERIARIAQEPDNMPEETVESLKALMRSFHLEPINRDLTEDEILGYGPNGHCE